MKFEEILPALREGKKVRRKAWPTDTYTMHPYDWEGRCMTFCESDVFQDDWEPFEDIQYMNFLEAVKVARETGKRIFTRDKGRNFGGIKITPKAIQCCVQYAPELEFECGIGWNEFLGDWYVE